MSSHTKTKQKKHGPPLQTAEVCRVERGRTRDGRAWQTRCWEGSSSILQIVFYYWYFTICSISICSSLLVFYYLERDRPGAERRGAEGRGQLYRVRLPSLGRKVHLLHRQKRPVIQAKETCYTYIPSLGREPNLHTCSQASRWIVYHLTFISKLSLSKN